MQRRAFLQASALLGLVGGRGFGAGSPAASDELIHLDSNENPLGLAPSARAAVETAISGANRYPDEARSELQSTLATRHGLSPANIVLGNGSTEVLQMIAQAAASPNATSVIAHPTFEALPWYERPHSFRIERVPLDSRHAHDIQQMRDLVARQRRPALVYLCNPNNPTGTVTPSKEIDEWISEAPETVLFAVDEAYHEYVDTPEYWSAEKWIPQRPNVIVARTFSKIYGMAGLRLGYALAHEGTAQRLREFMSQDNANSLALAAALASLADSEAIPRSRAVNRAAKKTVLSCLEELGLDSLPSETSFVMHRIRGDVETFRRRMRDHRILVGRPFPPLLSYNRLSLGLPGEMERWADVMRVFHGNGWV